jgi:hypothetical protein
VLAIYRKIKSLFHWPGIKTHTIEYVQGCQGVSASQTRTYNLPLQPLKVPPEAWHNIRMAFISESCPIKEVRGPDVQREANKRWRKKATNRTRVPSTSLAIPPVRSPSGGLGALEVWRTMVPRRWGVPIFNLVCF